MTKEFSKGVKFQWSSTKGMNSYCFCAGQERDAAAQTSEPFVFVCVKCARVGEAFRRPRFGSGVVRQQLSIVSVRRGQQDLVGKWAEREQNVNRTWTERS